MVALITSYNQKKNCCLPFAIDVLVFKEGQKHTVFPPISAHPLRQIHQASTRPPRPHLPSKRRPRRGNNLFIAHTKIILSKLNFFNVSSTFFLFYFTQLDTSNTLFFAGRMYFAVQISRGMCSEKKAGRAATVNGNNSFKL